MLIGNLEVGQAVWLAPMAGVTDSPFRHTAKRLGCPLLVSEMVSAEGLRRRNRASLGLLRFKDSERPIFAQLFGREPAVMAESARLCADLGFDGVDLNFGCPMRKVVGGGAGAALLKEPRRARQIAGAVRAAVRLPLSVKMRSGWSRDEIVAVELGRQFVEEGVDLLVLHPRTRDQFFRGTADWSLVRELASAVRVPVIGNGDVRSPGLARQRVKETGCAGVMIGRAALGAPWLPGLAARALAGEEDPLPPSPEEIYDIFCRHLEAMFDWLGDERQAVCRMRKHLVWYSRGLPGAARLRRNLASFSSVEQMHAVWQKLLAPSAGRAGLEELPS